MVARRSKTGVAMLGYGAVAELHAAALRQIGVTLVQVAGPNAAAVESFRARHRIAHAGTDVEAAVRADEVGIVVIASPSPVHVDQVRMALEAGRHVLVEIPLALALHDGEALVALAESRGVLLGVCHTLRFSEPFRLLRSTLDATGKRPMHVVARSLQHRREDVGWTGRRRSWTDNLLWHHGGHVIDMSLELLRSPVIGVQAAIGTRFSKSDDPMDCAIAIETEAGGVATIALSYNAVVPVSDFVVVAEDDTYLVDNARIRSAQGVMFEGDPREIEITAITEQDSAFIEGVRTGSRFGAEGRSILPTLRVQQAVAQATQS